MKRLAVLLFAIPSMAGATSCADRVTVDKSEHTLTVYARDEANSAFYRSIHISYPNNDWTDGCISLSNTDMKQFWQMVRVPVPIEIRP